ncbi:GNAT family N-acetyltransferase [Thaumasiovibrio subtropicus]|uniref:GNAT family N-acetyltransferase n=1 Tax=Thaumasiovibrio subtropicus TaxID=1891207 RepID=UPI000B350518|nr:GNAT family N-acetyltransferase [Thaumasiovibrio subtropicus]
MIRAATKDDASAINDIYNHYVNNTAITFDLAPWSLAERLEWMATFNRDDSPYKLFVYEVESQIVGFAYFNQFREKAAYRLSAELTLYLSPEYKGVGTGSELMNHLIKTMQKDGFKKAYSVITLPNAASVALHKKYAFSQVGKFTDVGFKFDRFHSVAIYERTLRFS